MPETDWKHDGVRVIPGDSLDTNTAQTPGMNRAAAINFARVGAQKIWAGTVHIHPDAKTGAHHHGALESVIYVIRGRARMRWGNQLEYVARSRSRRLHLRPTLRPPTRKSTPAPTKPSNASSSAATTRPSSSISTSNPSKNPKALPGSTPSTAPEPLRPHRSAPKVAAATEGWHFTYAPNLVTPGGAHRRGSTHGCGYS